MSQYVVQACRKVIPVALCLIPLLFIALPVNFSFLNVPISDYLSFPTASAANSAASGDGFSLDRRLLPMESTYQILDAGEGSQSTSQAPIAGSTINTDGYPYPEMRGYPAPSPFKRIAILINSEKAFQALLDTINAIFNIDSGTTDVNAELQMYRLTSLPSQIDTRMVGEAFSIRLVDENGQAITEFNRPITVTFELYDMGLRTNEEGELTAKPYQWSQSSGGWVPLEYEVSEDGSALTAVVTEPGEFILMENVRIFVPTIR